LQSLGNEQPYLKKQSTRDSQMLKGQGSSPEKNVQQRGSHITARKIASK